MCQAFDGVFNKSLVKQLVNTLTTTRVGIDLLPRHSFPTQNEKADVPLKVLGLGKISRVEL